MEDQGIIEQLQLWHVNSNELGQNPGGGVLRVTKWVVIRDVIQHWIVKNRRFILNLLIVVIKGSSF